VTAKTTPNKLLTILTSEAMEEMITNALLAAGGGGLTLSEARGRGAHGERPGKWAEGNVRIEMLGSEATVARALAAIDHLRADVDNVLVAWVSDVQAWPAEKFAR